MLGTMNHLKGPTNVINTSSAAVPYRVSRVAQPTQHRKVQGIIQNKSVDEEDVDDTWI